MKAINIFKTGILVSAIALLSSGAFAQAPNYTDFTSTGGESIDSVTVGSRMPYKTQAQTAVTGLVYQYKWLFENASGVNQNWTILDLAGATLTEATAGSGYYTNNEISVKMPTSPGTYKLRANVRTVFNGTALCEAADTLANITIVAKPTLAWPTPAQAATCYSSSMTSVNIDNIALTGFGAWEVEYTLAFSNFDGSGATSSTKNATIGTSASKAGNYSMPVDVTQAGLYKVTITKLTDRISRKALNPTEIAAVAGTDIPSGEFTLIVAPQPATKKLQHVRNM
ncbi:MAG: hypothetical protein LBQ60_18330 [Bacteroidales bacterium]|jgi:hypothetical protein|nr:hypothetical protein [Bacteroidales bacterium]